MNLGFGLVFGSDTKGAEAGIDRLVGGINHLGAQAVAVSESMADVFNTVIDKVAEFTKALIGQAAAIETSENTLRFAFRDLKDGGAIDDIWQKVQDTGLTTMQTTKEIADMVTTVKRMSNINLFDPKMPEVVDATGKKIASMANLVADIAAGSEFGMRSATRGIMALMHGEWGRAGRHLDPIAGKMDEYKKAMGSAKTETEKFIKIAPLLARDYGGAANAMTATWGYLASQITDVKEKLMQTLGKPMMDALKGPLNEMLSYFVGQPDGILLTANISKFDKIAQALSDIGGWVARAAVATGRLVKSVLEFTMEHPNLIKIAAAVAGLAAGIGALGAVLAAAKLAVAVLGFAFGGLLTAALPVIGIVAALASVGYILAKAAVNGENFSDTMERIGMVLSAAWEGLSNLDKGVATLSENTANALNEKGLLGVATTLMMVGYRVKRFFEGLWEGLKETFGPGGFAYESFQYLAAEVKTLMADIGETVGLSAKGASVDWDNSGKAVASVVGFLVGAFAYGFGLIVKAIDYAVKAISFLIDGLGAVKQGMNGLEQEAHPLLKTLREIKDIWDWYNDQGAYGPLDAVGSLADPQAAGDQGAWTNAGQYTKWIGAKRHEMEAGLSRPAAQQISRMYNPDNRTAWEKKQDDELLSGDPMASHHIPSKWLQTQIEISGSSTKALEDRLAKYHDAIVNGLSGMKVVLDGHEVGGVLLKQTAQMHERQGGIK